MIELVPIGVDVTLDILDGLAFGLAPVFRESCHVGEWRLDADFAFDPVRKQYYSTAILRRLAAGSTHRRLGVAAVDLYVPIFTFVFGEAQIGDRCGIVSQYRLRESFYGLQPNPELERQRLLKEAVHELGHTAGLQHCSDWRCAMTSSHTVDRMDLKEASFCRDCRKAARID